MTALAAVRKQPLLVQLPNGALVPAAGAQLANGGDMQIAGADPNAVPYTSGAFGPSDISAAGDGGAGPAAAVAPAPVALGAGHGGGAGPGESGALIATPKQADVMYAKGADAGPGLGALMQMAAMKKAGAGGDAGGDAGGAPSSGGGGSVLSKIFGGGGDSGGGDSGGGILDKLKGLFLGGASGPSNDLTGATVPRAGAVSTNPLAPIADDLGPVNVTPIAGALGQQGGGTGTALVPSSPMVDVATPRPRPDQIQDREGATLQPTDIQPPQPDAGALNITKPPSIKDPSFLDNLRSDPLRMALFMGGLKTMASASRPGATALGALGEGLGSGFEGAFADQSADEDRAMADRKQTVDEKNAASEGALRDSEAQWYKARPEIAGQTAKAAMTRAEAYAKFGAGKSASSPTALMKNAQYYVDNGVAPDLKTATNMLRSSVNDAATYQRLVQAEKKVIQSTPDGMSMDDGEIEKLAQDNVKARAQSAQAQTGALGGPAPKKGASNGGALGDAATPHSAADLDKLPSGAIYINPSDGKKYKKK